MKQFQTGEYHGKAALDSWLTRQALDGWEVLSITVTSARPALGLLFGIIGFWIFERQNVFHVTFTRERDLNA